MPKNNLSFPTMMIGAIAVWTSGILTPKKQRTKQWANGPFLSPDNLQELVLQDISYAIKNYNKPEKLEKSPLLKLSQVRSADMDKTPIDALKSLIRASIEYFGPTDDFHRRIKPNLKYHLLKMIAFDECEEGQILWELGFEEYPLNIISKEGSVREPLFKIRSASDYPCISRNAYLALKKEAINDILWRISYLERNCPDNSNLLCKKEPSRNFSSMDEVIRTN